MLGKLETFADERGHSMIELAFSWLASKPYVSSVIAGATRPEQVEQNAKSADWKLTERMVLAMHPMVQDTEGGGGISYLANSYIVTPGGGEAVSKVPLGIHVL